ncbi:unnamed protein product [Dovyalis caffra]|uniref:DUF4219 domain-containing protein n=1 Tax=Dovyalis caffra TaxID=77055 RepID=A0AAV1QW12_9ROSI|nr:unnamed protein product [Dovyalis caffra]
MATHVVPTAIVVEVLRDDNYKNWRACMKSYLMAQGLWDIIEPPPVEPQEVALLVQLNRNLAQRNAAALHAIQISCAPHILSKIRNQKLAKEAWEFLEGLLRSQRVYLEENPGNSHHLKTSSSPGRT